MEPDIFNCINYLDAETRNRLNEWTLDNFDETVMMFFASRIEFESLVKGGVRVSDIEEKALSEFETQLHNYDLESVTESSATGVKPDQGFRSSFHEYSAQYQVPDFSREMDIEGIGTRTIELNTTPLSVTGMVSIWRDGLSTGFVAGGIFPSERYYVSDTVSLSGGEVGNGIDTSVEINLRLTPDRYRQNTVNLVESVK